MQVFVSDSQYGINLSTGFSIAICLDCLIPMFTNFHFLFGRFLRSWLVWLGILIVWKSSQQLPKSQNPAGAAGAGGFLRSLHLGRCTTYVELCMIHVHTCSYSLLHLFDILRYHFESIEAHLSFQVTDLQIANLCSSVRAAQHGVWWP
jgi:hypothetical protein